MFADDSDGRDNTITYSLSGIDAENFTIDSNGAITHTVFFPDVESAEVSLS